MGERGRFGGEGRRKARTLPRKLGRKRNGEGQAILLPAEKNKNGRPSTDLSKGLEEKETLSTKKEMEVRVFGCE